MRTIKVVFLLLTNMYDRELNKYTFQFTPVIEGQSAIYI